MVARLIQFLVQRKPARSSGEGGGENEPAPIGTGAAKTYRRDFNMANTKKWALRQGDEFIIATRSQMNAAGVRTRKTGREVVLRGEVIPVIEKKNWDYCDAVDGMFKAAKKAAGAVFSLPEFLVNEITICDHRGIHVEHPQWCETW